jgi:hypothetical protein
MDAGVWFERPWILLSLSDHMTLPKSPYQNEQAFKRLFIRPAALSGQNQSSTVDGTVCGDFALPPCWPYKRSLSVQLFFLIGALSLNTIQIQLQPVSA